MTTPSIAPLPRRRRRGRLQRLKDFLSFPLRAVTLFHEDWGGFSCQATERYDEVAHAARLPDRLPQIFADLDAQPEGEAVQLGLAFTDFAQAAG